MSEPAFDDTPSSRIESLKRHLDSGTLQQARRTLQSLHPAEIASLLEGTPSPERELVWELVDPDDEGEVLLHVNDEVRGGLIKGMDNEELVAATEGLDMDDLADIIDDLPQAVTRQVLTSMDRQERVRLEQVLAYPEDSAGGLMNTDTVTVRPDVTVDVVMRYLRLRGDLPELTDKLVVTDRYGRYVGELNVNRLLTREPDAHVSDIMSAAVEPIEATTAAREVAKRFEDYDLISAPVVDERGYLLGRITIDDVVDVIREEAEHSLMSMAGLDEEEDMFAPVLPSARRRSVWLGTNLVTAFMAAAVVSLFQDTIHQVVALAVLMPVVASMGGIAGGQTLTLVIRGLALGHVHRSNTRLLLSKEVLVGALNGAGWALLVGMIAALWFTSYWLAVVIFLAMMANMLCAALAGVAIPLVMKRLRIDPAIAGNVVLTTVTDIVGFFAFLGLGTALLL